MSSDTTTGLRLSLKLALARGAMLLARSAGLPFRDRAYRAWYDAISEFSEVLFEDFYCMNYGYAPSRSVGPETYQLGLYDYLATFEPLTGRSILEVGSGRGGGAAHIHRAHGAREVTGIDLSAPAVRASEERFSAPGLTYQTGNAEHLPFPDDRFDVLLNVESSHCYPDIAAFLGEARRVLRPGGSLLLADFRHKAEVHLIGDTAERVGFKVAHQSEISANVLEALESDDLRKRKMIDACPAVPKVVQGSIRHFAGCIGSPMHRDFQSGERVYLAYRLVA